MKIVKKNNVYFLNLDSQEESYAIESFLSKPLVLSKQKNVLKISLEEKDLVSVIDKKKKILALLNDKSLTFQDKLEGSFEKLLNEDDLLIFQDMLEKKEIEVYKPSLKYKKGVYQTTSLKEKITFSKNNNLEKKNDSDFSEFEVNKYIIFKDVNLAKKFSFDFKELINSKEVLGIKSFDGNYYVIYKHLFLKIKDSIFGLNLREDFSIDFLIDQLSYPRDALKVVIEILKEEGFIIEKRKGNYSFV